jgi:hypothetical protein
MKLIRSKLDKLKDRARTHYLAYMAILDDFDCGIDMAEHLSSSMCTHKLKFNDAMDKIRELDSNAPLTRL